MSTNMESMQRTPSVIARLMGLDDLPTHQPVQKKRRVLSENYLRKVASIGVREKHSSKARPSFKFGIDEKKEFKDVFDILENLKRNKDCNLSIERGDVNLSLSKVQTALLSQSFGDAKRVSVDNESKTSNEDHDKLGVAGSKMDLFIKYLQEPYSSSCKHLHALQGIPHLSQSAKITVLKSSHAPDFANTDRCMKSGRGTDQGSDKLISKLQTGLVADSHENLGKMRKFLRSQTKSDKGAHLPSTKIVVLKPKPGKTGNAARYLLSSSSHGDSHSINKKHEESHSPENGNSFAQVIEMKNVTKNVKSVRRRSRFSKEIVKQTGSKSSLSTRVSKSGIKGTETFAKESELMMFSSPNTSDREDHYEPTFYCSDGSYMARESKKDILERWKTNKKFQEVGVTSGGRTQGEALAMPDHDSRCRNLDVRLEEDGYSSEIGLCSDRFMRSVGSANWLRQRPRKQIYNKKDGDVLQHELKRKLDEKDQCQQTSVLFNLSSCSGFCSYSENGSCVQENKSVQEEQIMLEERDPSEENFVESSSSGESFTPAIMVADLETSVETEDVGMTFKNHKEHQFKPTECTLFLKEDDISSSVPNTLTQQDMSIGISEEDSVSSFCSCTDPESLIYSEEAYQPSPNSVLEPPFEKEISFGTECFHGVNASLHGLQLQLELLKSESEEYSEGTGMIVSSDDDSEKGSFGNYEESEKSMKINVEESRDYSYLIDIFIEAGFHGSNLDAAYDKGHSPECPISHAVFEMLEKRYGEQISWKRSDRRLLFDRINSELTKFLQPSIGTHWTKPVRTRLSYRKSLEVIKDEVWISLVSQEKQANNDLSLKLLMGKDDGWLELGDEMDGIVNEIENSLIDELATEVVSMESF